MEKVTIVMPAYNEEKRIGRTLEAYALYFDNVSRARGFSYEILVVINGTTDNTEGVVNEVQKKHGCIRVVNFERNGKGFAVIEGTKLALEGDANLIGFVDADMATGPEQFDRLIRGIKGRDGAIASRYVKESTVMPAFTFRRAVVARVFNLIVRSLFLFPYSDTQCGAKLFSRRASEKIVEHVKMSRWAFDVEQLYCLGKFGYKVREVPTVWTDMEGGTLVIGKASLQMLLAVIQLRIRNSPFGRLLGPVNPVTSLIWSKLK